MNFTRKKKGREFLTTLLLDYRSGVVNDYRGLRMKLSALLEITCSRS